MCWLLTQEPVSHTILLTLTEPIIEQYSPGMRMRFKALNIFTDKLPKVSAKGEVPMYGQSTETAIRAGVIRGMEFEMSGYITHLQKNYPELLGFFNGRR